MSEKPRLNREYVRSFVFGTKLISLLILLVAPLLLWVALFSGGSTIIQKIPIFYLPELKILEVQNFAFSTMAGDMEVTMPDGKVYEIDFPESSAHPTPTPVMPSAIPVTTKAITDVDRKAFLAARLPESSLTLTSPTPEQARQELARRELARRELARTKQTSHEGTRMTADQAIKEAEDYLASQQTDLSSLSDEEIIRHLPDEVLLRQIRPSQIQPAFDFSTAQPVPSVRYELGSGEYKLYVRVTRSFRNENEREQLQRAVVEIVSDNRTKKMKLKEDPDKVMWYDIPWLIENVVYGRYTTPGTIVGILGALAITVVCLALYFPLFRAIFNLFKKKRIISA